MIREIRKNNETLQIGTLQDRQFMESAAPFAGYEATVVCLRRFMHDAYNMTVLRKVLYADSYQFGIHSLSDQEVISQVARKAVQGQIFIARGKAAQYGGGSSSPSVKEVVQAEGKKWSKKEYVESFIKEHGIEPAVPSKNNPSCCVTEVQVSCSHYPDKRIFRLEVPNPKTKRGSKYQIELLAGGADVDTISVSLSGGPCVKGNPTGKGANEKVDGAGDAAGRVPHVSLSGPNLNLKALAPFKADLKGPSSKTGFDLLTFVKTLFTPSSSTAQTYQGTVECCERRNNFDFLIKVFPDIHWKGEISIGYEFGRSDNFSKVVEYSNQATKKADEPLLVKKAKIYTVDDEGKFSIEGSISGGYGAQKFDVNMPTFERKGIASKGSGAFAFKHFKRFFEKILPRMHTLFSNDLVEIKPTWPKVTFGGDMKLVESKDDYDVHQEGSIYLKLDPLIGLEGTTDLLDWLCYACGPVLGLPNVGKWLVKLKSKAEKGWGNKAFGGSCKLAINLSATGKVNGALQWTFRPGQDECTGELASNLVLKLEGVAESEVHSFCVSGQWGAKISATTGVSGKINPQFYGPDPGFHGQFSFDGLIIKSMVYSSVGGSSVGKGSPGSSESMLGNKINGEKTRTKNQLFPKLEVLPPAKWPNNSNNQDVKLKQGG